MSFRRSTLGLLAVLCVSVGMLVVTATAEATGPPAAPTITSVTVNGSDLTTDGNGNYYTNDPIDLTTGLTTDGFDVTVQGDPSASQIVFEGPNGQQTAVPDVNGDATFAVGSLQQYPTYNSILAYQTVSGQDSALTQDTIYVNTVPVISSPQNDLLATDATLFVGGAIPGDPVELTSGANVVIVTADSSGTAYFPAADFSTDYQSVTVQSIDAQGDGSDVSGLATFYVAPPAPTILTPVSSSLHIAFNNQSEPVITASGVLPGATVALSLLDDQTGLSGPSIDVVTSVSGGTVTLQPTAPVADGAQLFIVTQTYTEGTGVNVFPVSSDWTALNADVGLLIDTAAPTLQTSFTGAYTNDNEPGFLYSLAGVYSNVAEVRLIDATTGQTLADASATGGEWVPTSPLLDGYYSVYAVSVDDAGDVGTAQSPPVDFTVDTVAPPAPTVTSPIDGSTVTTATPAITTTGNEPGATICAYLDGGNGAIAVPCVTADGNGDASFVVADALVDGQHDLVTIAEDAAGNDSDTITSFTVNTATATPPVSTTPAPPAATTPARPTGSGPPVTVAVAVATATSKTGVVELSAAQSTAPSGTTITGYAWYLGAKRIGRTKTLDYQLTAATARQTVTLRVTDSAGGTSTTQVDLSAHVHTTSVELSARTLFAFKSARLTPAAEQLLTKLRPAILPSAHVAIDGYTAPTGPQSTQQAHWTARLSTRRAQAVSAFLFGAHAPAAMQLTVTGRGAARDSAGATQDRRSTVTYERLVVAIDR